MDWQGGMGLAWIYDLWKRYDDVKVPLFAHLNFMETHTSGQHAIDAAVADWLERTPTSFWEKTIFMFLSDHGEHVHLFAATKDGIREHKNSFLELVVPPAISAQYESLDAILHGNQRKLMTTLDIYESLMHIFSGLDQPPRPPKSLGRSFFTPLDKCRTCKSVGIEEFECICRNSRERELEINSDKARTKILEMMRLLNEGIAVKAPKVCARVQVKKVLSGEEMTGVSPGEKSYTFRFETLFNSILRVTMHESQQMQASWITRVVQETTFHAKLAPCREAAEKTGISLHLCHCK
jgi:hypothetical protein